MSPSRSQLRKPRLASKTKEEPKLFDALSTFGTLLPKSAGLFVSLTGIAYFSGWREKSAYYKTLGAPWIMPTVPRFSFLESSAGMMVLIVLCAYFALQKIAPQKRGTNKILWASLIAMFTSALLSIMSDYLPQRWATPVNTWALMEVAATLMYSATGLLVGEAIARFRDDRLKWSSHVVYILYTAIYFGLYMTPSTLGISRAEYHLAAPSNALPSVTIVNAGRNEGWRLVELVGSSALLMKSPANVSRPVFRLVELKDVSEIVQLPSANAVSRSTTAPKVDASSGHGQSSRPESPPRPDHNS
jgi:hypothetical protein